MHRHYTDSEALRLLLPPFFGGPFIVKKGRGTDTLVFAGLTDTIIVPDPAQQRVAIVCRALCERVIGCHADFTPSERWKTIPPPLEGLVFDYRWFYEQKKRGRLKLVAPHHDRCWLCSHTNSVQRELFPAELMKMFLDECLHGVPLLRRLRDRFLHIL